MGLGKKITKKIAPFSKYVGSASKNVEFFGVKKKVAKKKRTTKRRKKKK